MSILTPLGLFLHIQDVQKARFYLQMRTRDLHSLLPPLNSSLHRGGSPPRTPQPLPHSRSLRPAKGSRGQIPRAVLRGPLPWLHLFWGQPARSRKILAQFPYSPSRTPAALSLERSRPESASGSFVQRPLLGLQVLAPPPHLRLLGFPGPLTITTAPGWPGVLLGVPLTHPPP